MLGDLQDCLLAKVSGVREGVALEMGKSKQQNIIEMCCHCPCFLVFPWWFMENIILFYLVSEAVTTSIPRKGPDMFQSAQPDHPVVPSVLSTRQLETGMDQDAGPGFLQPNLLRFKKAITGGTSYFHTPTSQHLQLKSQCLFNSAEAFRWTLSMQDMEANQGNPRL